MQGIIIPFVVLPSALTRLSKAESWWGSCVGVFDCAEGFEGGDCGGGEAFGDRVGYAFVGAIAIAEAFRQFLHSGV
jgi:hypothetical protein